MLMPNLASYIQYTVNNKCINAFNSDFYEEGYHLSWILQHLLGAYHIMTKEERMQYQVEMSHHCHNNDHEGLDRVRIAIRQKEEHSHECFYLQPFEEVDEGSKEYNREEAKNAMIYLKAKAAHGKEGREN